MVNESPVSFAGTKSEQPHSKASALEPTCHGDLRTITEHVEKVLADYARADQILALHLGPKTKCRLELAAARNRFIERFKSLSVRT